MAAGWCEAGSLHEEDYEKGYHLEKPEKLRKKCEAQLEAAKKKKEVVEQ